MPSNTLPTPKSLWHTRATWPAREDRLPSAVVLGILWIGILAGFGTDFARYIHQKPAPPLIVHIHAAVFSVWMFLLTAQVLLVLRNRIAWHRTLGWIAAAWACIMLILGPWAAMASQATHIHDKLDFSAFLAVNLVDVLGFFMLLAAGIAQRKTPAAHKRLMILSSVSLADPGFNRFIGLFWTNVPTSPATFFIYVFFGNILLIAVMTIWDIAKGRLLRSFVIGAASLLAAEYLAAWLLYNPSWGAFTHRAVIVWASHFG